MLGQWAVATAVTAAAGLAAATPAHAEDDSTLGQYECGSTGTGPGCDVSAARTDGPDSAPGAPPGGVSGGVSGGGEPRCRYEKAEGVTKRRDLMPPKGKRRGDGGAWFWRICRMASGDDVSRRVWLEPDEDGDAGTADPRVVAEMARDRLRLPSPRVVMSPPVDETHLVRRLPTWMWLAESSWGAESASARVPGVEVTATARAAGARWSMGDGATETCKGPGTPFDPARYRGDEESPDCGHRYLRSSTAEPDGVFRVRVRVLWPVTWSGGGESGSLPPLVTRESARLRVDEAPALIDRGD